jgi:hypothetical protein
MIWFCHHSLDGCVTLSRCKTNDYKMDQKNSCAIYIMFKMRFKSCIVLSPSFNGVEYCKKLFDTIHMWPEHLKVDDMAWFLMNIWTCHHRGLNGYWIFQTFSYALAKLEANSHVSSLISYPHWWSIYFKLLWNLQLRFFQPTFFFHCLFQLVEMVKCLLRIVDS